MSTKNLIKCPYCSAEYLAAEIFYPDTFLGQPKNIVKDEKSEILAYNGSDMNPYETYQCDHCGKKFSVEATVTFKTTQLVDIFEENDNF